MLVAKQISGEEVGLIVWDYVNYAGSKTDEVIHACIIMFENYVNYAGSKTCSFVYAEFMLFENYVNYAGSKTVIKVWF